MDALKALKRWLTDPALAKRKKFLSGLELFKNLSSSELGHVAQGLHARTYRPGEIVFVEGDIGRALFILESGEVQLNRQGPDGKSVPLYTLKPGEFFGEMALLESLPRSATAVATQTSRLHLLYRSKLESLLHAEPRVGAAIMGHLARLLSARLRRATGALAAHPVPHA
jgi:CRP-like cAMP-binding protein